ncbi:MAG: hypothetical protein RL180_382, partial [Pseudomonadota bacterium]
MTNLPTPDAAAVEGRAPQTRRGAERRAALLAAADELFLQRGYDAVS